MSVILKVTFGVDQKLGIDPVIKQTKEEKLILRSVQKEYGEHINYEITFLNVHSVYKFGREQIIHAHQLVFGEQIWKR